MWCISILTIQTVIHCILHWPSLVFMDDRVDKVGSCIVLNVTSGSKQHDVLLDGLNPSPLIFS